MHTAALTSLVSLFGLGPAEAVQFRAHRFKGRFAYAVSERSDEVARDHVDVSGYFMGGALQQVRHELRRFVGMVVDETDEGTGALIDAACFGEQGRVLKYQCESAADEVDGSGREPAQKIAVAIGPVGAARHRADQCNRGDVVLVCESSDGCTMPAEDHLAAGPILVSG